MLHVPLSSACATNCGTNGSPRQGLPWEAFSAPGWEKQGVDELYRERATSDEPSDAELTRRIRAGAYAIHLFQSHQNVKGHLAKLTEQYVRTVDTAFNAIVRPLLDESLR